MTNRTKLQHAVDAKLRVMELLPQEGDLSLIILKGHLLIEELLNILVRSAVKYPEAIKSANLSFYKLALIAKALFYEKNHSFLWDAIFELNKLRNTLAHNLETPDLEKMLRSFARAGSGGNPEAENLVVTVPQRVMVGSIEVMCGALIGLIGVASENGL